MDDTTYEMRLANWKSIVERCQARPEGQSARRWLADNGISDKQYYYWLRKIRADAYGSMRASLSSLSESTVPTLSFAEIPSEQLAPVPAAPAIVIKTRRSTIEISDQVSESMMIRIVKAVSHAL